MFQIISAQKTFLFLVKQTKHHFSYRTRRCDLSFSDKKKETPTCLHLSVPSPEICAPIFLSSSFIWSFSLLLSLFSIYYLFTYLLGLPVFCMPGIYMRHIICIRGLCIIKTEFHFPAGLGHPCLFPALYFSGSLFDIIWPTCLLSNPVCSTLCLSAFMFVLMFTLSKDVFVLCSLLLLLQWGGFFCCCSCQD